MVVIFICSLFWIIYGLLGVIFGIQINVPRKFRNTEHEKPYKRFMGLAYLLMGVSWFVVWLMVDNMIIAPEKWPVILAICIVPVIFAIIVDRRFRKRPGR